MVAPSPLKFAGRVGQEAEQIFVVHAGDMHPSLERVVSVHEAHDVQGDAPEDGEALRPVQGSVLLPVLVHDDVENPMQAVLGPPVVADELQPSLRRNLRAQDEVADGPLRPAFRSRPASILPTALAESRRSRSPQTAEFYFGAFGKC